MPKQTIKVKRFGRNDWKRAIARAERDLAAARDSLAFVQACRADSAAEQARDVNNWTARVGDAEAALAALRLAAGLPS